MAVGSNPTVLVIAPQRLNLPIERIYSDIRDERTPGFRSPTVARVPSPSKNWHAQLCARSIEPVSLVRLVNVYDLDHTDFLIRFENVVKRGVGPTDMQSVEFLPVDYQFLFIPGSGTRPGIRIVS